MRLKVRAAGAVSAAMLGASALTFAGTMPASAAPGHCYPPSQCHVGFDKDTYKRGHKVKFDTGKAFDSHEKVSGTLKCKHHFVRHTRKFKAGAKGRVKTDFHVPAHAPNGTCKFILVGLTSGDKITSTFQVNG